jgi:uncharacterized membrane protein (DUF485 family)
LVKISWKPTEYCFTIASTTLALLPTYTVFILLAAFNHASSALALNSSASAEPSATFIFHSNVAI